MSFIKKALLFPVKVTGTLALTATTVTTALLRQASDIAGFEIGSDLFGAGQDASIQGIKSIWTSNSNGRISSEESQESYYSRLIIEKNSAAAKCYDMAQAAKKAGNSEKARQFMERHDCLREEAKALQDECNRIAR